MRVGYGLDGLAGQVGQIHADLVVAAHFWGFVGMVVAIPAAAVINIVVKVLTGRYYSSRYYGTALDSRN